jgi:alpha-tubulin suppressor-like RCC1 family protein
MNPRTHWPLLIVMLSASSLAACASPEEVIEQAPDEQLVGQSALAATSVSAGARHTCAVRADHRAVCWGDDRYGQSTPPPGEFLSVAAGAMHSCGIRTDGTVACWGETGADEVVPDRTFTSLAAGYMHTCGIRTDGTAACWGRLTVDGNLHPPAGTFLSITAGPGNPSTGHTCGVRTDHTVACWGDGNYAQFGQGWVPDGTFSSVGAGALFSCGVSTDGAVRCWGFAPVSLANNVPGVGRCRGPCSAFDRDPARSLAELGEFASVTTGDSHTCGLRKDGTVACWGSNSAIFKRAGQANAPEGTFSIVDAGRHHNCGVRTDGTVACWGDDTWGQSTPPADVITTSQP